MFFTMIVSLSMLVSEIAILPKLILADLIKYCRSSQILFNKEVLILNLERQLFLLGIFTNCSFAKS